MKILFPTDGSESAKRAQALIASVAWPTPTQIDVLYVDQLVNEDLTLPEAQLSTLHRMLREDTDKQLAAVKASLSGPDRDVRTAMIIGRPASAIIAAARRLESDLVIIGSRGHGAFASALLGSVATEVVAHAPGAVLVARRTGISRLVLAHDGSDSARQAEELVGGWPFLNRLPVVVESVADLMPWWYTASVGEAPVNAEIYQQVNDDLHADRGRIAREAAARLVARGVPATAELREGTAAAAIIDAAAESKADLIVIGSRGRTGLARLVLGSVARNVLFHAPCSVLITRQKVATEREAAGSHEGRATTPVVL